ncbi:ankyrin repeat-containing domain protein [Cladochytrium replicatum]|nr:ankyrin repeat-containing domain protein [Cladochytrium replicatum]
MKDPHIFLSLPPELIQSIAIYLPAPSALIRTCKKAHNALSHDYVMALWALRRFGKEDCFLKLLEPLSLFPPRPLTPSSELTIITTTTTSTVLEIIDSVEGGSKVSDLLFHHNVEETNSRQGRCCCRAHCASIVHIGCMKDLHTTVPHQIADGGYLDREGQFHGWNDCGHFNKNEIRRIDGEKNNAERCDYPTCSVCTWPNVPAGVVEHLFEMGCNVFAHNAPVVRWMAEVGRTDHKRLMSEALRKIIDSTDTQENFWMLTLLRAIRSGKVCIVEEILRYRLASSNICYRQLDEALREAARRGHVELVALLSRSGANPRSMNDSALCLAALHGHPDCVKWLAETGGCDVRAQGDFALKKAIEFGHSKVVRYLVVERCCPVMGWELQSGIRAGCYETVAILLRSMSAIETTFLLRNIRFAEELKLWDIKALLQGFNSNSPEN